MYLFWILILGFIMRLAYILKPEGLWNDEYVSWMIASTPFQEGFFPAIFKQCHMPFYYLYLKMFGDNDILLRLSSVIPGVISIFVMFKIGELKSKQAAYLMAFFTAISSFLIYYSQEVRFYSLLFLFSALSLLFLLKLIKSRTFLNSLGFILSSFMILFTHAIGFVYVIFLFLYLAYKIKLSNKIWGGLLGILAITIPFSIYIFSHSGVSQWWSIFTYKNIIFMFTDFFSPILTNDVNVQMDILYKKNAIFIMSLLIPTLLSLFFIAKSLNDKNNRELFYIAIATTIVLSLTAFTGKFVFITKYNIEILPILMFLFVSGIVNSHKTIKICAVIIYASFQLGYVFTPDYPSKLPHLEGNRLPATLLLQLKPSSKDRIVFTYYNSDRFSKYIDLSEYDVVNIDKSYISNVYAKYDKDLENIIHNTTLIHPEFKILIKRDARTFFIFLDSVSFFKNDQLKAYIEGRTTWDKIHPLYIMMSVFKNELLSYSKKHNLVVKSLKLGSWTVVCIEEK